MDWYREGKVRVIILQYYSDLRSILHNKPRLQKFLTRCKHCQIYFLTTPQNAGRHDLGCPFGCRQAQQQKNSNMRSIEYYRTKEGKIKKKIQNEKRKKNKTTNIKKIEKIIFNKTTFEYIWTITSLLEGRKVTKSEIFAMLENLLRQHSIASEKKWRYFNQSGP